MTLLVKDARIVSGPAGPPFSGCVRLDGNLIEEVGARLVERPNERVLEAKGRVLLPGFVDAHTHAAFAGDRLDEFELKRAGKSYLEILASGGGIQHTVRAVRSATADELGALLSERLLVMLSQGTTTVEVKSGYGLSTAEELKLLGAIKSAAGRFPGTVVATALLGHALDPENPRFVTETIEETLPAVHAEFPEVAIDAYCESGAWSVADCRRLFERARELGHPLRLHADQFTALGGVELALELGALSVDHLESTPPEVLQRLAESRCFGVMLPVTGFHTDDRYANARAFLNAGGQLVLATNYNPGSAPSCSIPFVHALALRKLGLDALEAIAATTSTPAALLGLNDRGLIRPGFRADLVLLRHRDERLLAYEVGGNPVDLVLAGGREVWRAPGV